MSGVWMFEIGGMNPAASLGTLEAAGFNPRASSLGSEVPWFCAKISPLWTSPSLS